MTRVSIEKKMSISSGSWKNISSMFTAKNVGNTLYFSGMAGMTLTSSTLSLINTIETSNEAEETISGKSQYSSRSGRSSMQQALRPSIRFGPWPAKSSLFFGMPWFF